jgi:hypothetical protein
LHAGITAIDTATMDAGAAVMSRTPTRPVQVRLPEPAAEFLEGLSRERGESKTEIVIEALELLRQQVLERRMEAGYRELADEQGAENDQLVQAGLAASLPTIPD